MNPALDPLLAWYARVKRPLPWRVTGDPYAVWVSEIMLQQTGVSVVIPYFERWMARFPTVEALADAPEADALALWQGLGYYSRCRNLIAGARAVVSDGWPTDVDGWRNIPGVGPYTAGAICSIALEQAVPLVDGNVERVYARLENDATPKPTLTALAWTWATAEVRPSAPGNWNQALMELGATVCTPTNPKCPACPVASGCKAMAANTQNQLPTRLSKPPMKQLRHSVWVPVFQGRIGLRQSGSAEWWAGLWCFPRFDLGEKNGPGPNQHSNLPLEAFFPIGSTSIPLSPIAHTVTRHRIQVTPFVVNLTEPIAALRWFSPEEFEGLAMPAPDRVIWKQALARSLVSPAQANGTGARSHPSLLEGSGTPLELAFEFEPLDTPLKS